MQISKIEFISKKKKKSSINQYDFNGLKIFTELYSFKIDFLKGMYE